MHRQAGRRWRNRDQHGAGGTAAWRAAAAHAGADRRRRGFPGKYPAVNGTPGLRRAIAEWLDRRYGLGAGQGIDPETEVIPLNGTREGLFALAQIAVPAVRAATRPLVLTPNPFYQCYLVRRPWRGRRSG